MIKGQIVDDSTFFKWLVGSIAAAYLLVLKWTHHRATSAHIKIDDERKDNEDRINKVYEKIAEGVSKTEKCRDEIKKDLEVRMKAPDIKEYVGMSITPLANKVDEIHTDVKALLARELK